MGKSFAETPGQNQQEWSKLEYGSPSPLSPTDSCNTGAYAVRYMAWVPGNEAYALFLFAFRLIFVIHVVLFLRFFTVISPTFCSQTIENE